MTTICLSREKSLRKKKKKNRVIDIESMLPNTEYNECKCLKRGKYKFEFFDLGDGFEKKGYLKLYLNGKKILKVNSKTGDWRKQKKTLKIK